VLEGGGLVKVGFACEGGGVVDCAVADDDAGADEDEAIQEQLGLHIS
jgi:hypothetical protein